MRATVFHGTRDVRIEEVPDATLREVLLAARDRSLYLRDWAISFALVVAGVAIIGLRGIVPPLASIFFGNALAALGAAGIFVGLCRFMQRPVPWLLLASLIAVSLAVIGWFSVGVNDPAAQLGPASG